MGRILNAFAGTVRVEAHTPSVGQFFNMCAGINVRFWDAQSADGIVSVTIHSSSYSRLAAAAAKTGISLERVGAWGAPVLFGRMKKRYVLLAGLLCCFVMVWYASLFIWEIEVSGNKEVSVSEILTALEKSGFTIGTFGPGVEPEELSNEVLLVVPELSWIAVNITGCRANVLVREAVVPPEVVDEDAPTEVYAVKSGLISKMIVLSGKRIKEVGDTVLAGEVLVTGEMDSLSSGVRYEHAMADVYARTWYEFEVCMPLQLAEKEYTGEEKVHRSLIIAGKRVNMYFDSGISYEEYDKITEEKSLVLPDGTVLPIAVVAETFREYRQKTGVMDVEAAAGILKQRLLARLRDEIGGGEITAQDFLVQSDGDTVTVTLRAECVEQIGKIRALNDIRNDDPETGT